MVGSSWIPFAQQGYRLTGKKNNGCQIDPFNHALCAWVLLHPVPATCIMLHFTVTHWLEFKLQLREEPTASLAFMWALSGARGAITGLSHITAWDMPSVLLLFVLGISCSDSEQNMPSSCPWLLAFPTQGTTQFLPSERKKNQNTPVSRNYHPPGPFWWVIFTLNL